VIIYRGTPVADAHGNLNFPPVDDWPEVGSFDGKYGPSDPAEGIEPGRNVVVEGGSVYSRDPAAFSILDSDAIGINGVRYLVDSHVEHWASTGVRFKVKAVTG